MPIGNKKGSSFERKICKSLSLWWSGGKTDAIFWRSSQSGGRATQRAKSGKATFGQYGDISAVDPIGQPLLTLFTIELKRGRSHGHPADILDTIQKGKKPTPFEQTLNQAIEQHVRAKSKSWLLIVQQDRKKAMVYVPSWLYACLCPEHYKKAPVRYCLTVRPNKLQTRFFGLLLADFFAQVNPDAVRTVLEELEKS